MGTFVHSAAPSRPYGTEVLSVLLSAVPSAPRTVSVPEQALSTKGCVCPPSARVSIPPPVRATKGPSGALGQTPPEGGRVRGKRHVERDLWGPFLSSSGTRRLAGAELGLSTSLVYAQKSHTPVSRGQEPGEDGQTVAGGQQQEERVLARFALRQQETDPRRSEEEESPEPREDHRLPQPPPEHLRQGALAATGREFAEPRAQ